MARYQLSAEDIAAIQAEAETRPCPLCGAPCHWFSDCPGYGNPVHVCFVPYDATIPSTGKDVWAMACGNATLWVCQNEDCDWQYRIPNCRGDALGPAPTTWEATDRMNETGGDD